MFKTRYTSINFLNNINGTFWLMVHTFFISNTFITNTRLKLAKNQANAKQNPEAEDYSHSSSTLWSKNNRAYSKRQAKEQVCLYSWDYAINHNENEDEKEK